MSGYYQDGVNQASFDRYWSDKLGDRESRDDAHADPGEDQEPHWPNASEESV